MNSQYAVLFGIKQGPIMVQAVRLSTIAGGMKRRLSVAMALIGDPLVCYLDEPSTGPCPLGGGGAIVGRMSRTGFGCCMSCPMKREGYFMLSFPWSMQLLPRNEALNTIGLVCFD